MRIESAPHLVPPGLGGRWRGIQPLAGLALAEKRVSHGAESVESS